MQIDVTVALQLAAVGVIAWAIYRDRHAKRASRAARDFAWRTFRETAVDSADPRQAFSGAASRVLKVEETGVAWDLKDPTFGSYALAIFAANEAGEVFHFRFSGGSCLLKPVAPAVARAVLGEAPPQPPGSIPRPDRRG